MKESRQTKQNYMNYKLDVELSKELEPYRNTIEATIKPIAWIIYEKFWQGLKIGNFDQKTLL